MNNKFTALAAVAALAFIVAGCDSSSSDKEDDHTTTKLAQSGQHTAAIPHPAPMSSAPVANKPSPSTNNTSTKTLPVGTFERKGENSATITLNRKDNDQIEINGMAVWVKDVAKGQVNNGEISGILDEKDGGAVHYNSNGCQLNVTAISADEIKVDGDNGQCGGQNVTFNGSYHRVGS